MQKARTVPPLDKKAATRWTKLIRKELVRKKGQATLARKGTNYFYDKKTKRGKYIVSGGGNRKGLVFGLHGGGVGSADCTGAASSFSGAVSSMGMIGIYPEAIEATEAAWGDDITVKFVMDLLAAARRTFKFDHDRVYVVGHSMGGYGAWTLGGRFADHWAGAASFAGGPTCIGGPLNPESVQAGVLPNRFNCPLFVYHSDDDPRVPIPPIRLAIKGLKALKKEHPKGFTFKYEEVSGRGHAFPKKGPRPGLKWITGFKRQTRPRKIVWECYYSRPSQSYWLEHKKAMRGDVSVATWDGKATFRVSTESLNHTDLAVLLDDGMTDLDKPVTVYFDDQKVFEGVPKRSLHRLLVSAIRRRDPNMLFSASIPVAAQRDR